MKHLVIGAGALGSWLAHNLVRGELEVQLVDIDPARRTRLEQPLALHGYRTAPALQLSCMGWADLHGTDLHAAFDVAYLCVKPWETDAALEALHTHQPNPPALVCCVGGLGSLRLSDTWPAEVMHAVVQSEVRLRDDGDLETGFGNFIWLGNLGRTLTPLMENVQRALSWAAPTLTTKVIEGIVWAKLAFSLEAGLPALAGIKPTTFFADPAARRAAAHVVGEVQNVAERFGIAPIGGDFFDPPLYRASSPGQRVTLDTWIKHAWSRHEQFRFGLDYPFPDVTGLGWSLSPENPREELSSLLTEIRQAATAVGVSTLGLNAYDALVTRARSGVMPRLEEITRLAAPEFVVENA